MLATRVTPSLPRTEIRKLVLLVKEKVMLLLSANDGAEVFTLEIKFPEASNSNTLVNEIDPPAVPAPALYQRCRPEI